MKKLILLLLLLPAVQAQYIDISQSQYQVGEHVTIVIHDPNISLEIMSPTNLYRYLGVPEDHLQFTPREEGRYEVRALRQDSVAEAVTFTVGTTEQQGFSRIRIRNSQNQLLHTPVNMYQEGDLLSGGSSFDVLSVAHGIYDIDLPLEKEHVKHMRFHDVNFQGSFELGFEELPTSAVDMYWKNTNAVYAIDPTAIDFVNATVTAVARGHELYKCQDYNFTEQHCYGDYVKVMDLTPGQEYNFTLTPKDPQYTEQTSATQGCACTANCQNGPGATSQCTATCNDYCDIDFTVPPGALDGWLEVVNYSVDITIGGTGTPVSAGHGGRLDKDQTPNSVNDVSIGTSTTTTTASVVFSNPNMPDRGDANSFDDISCSTWDQGYCTWKPYLYSDYTCSGSRKTCDTTISLTLIDYTWNYTADTTPPSISLGDPKNNSYTASSSSTFYYTATDVSGIQNCSLYLNDVRNQTNPSVSSGIQSTFSVTGMQDSQYNWSVQCFDSPGNLGTSATKNLVVDTNSPGIDFIPFTPANNSYLSTDSFTINVSHTEVNPDTLSLYWQGSPERQSYSGTYTDIARTSLLDGTYSYYVEVNDSAANTNMTGARYVTIDTTPPSVSLDQPDDGQWVNTNSVTFSYTPTDTNLKNCSLYGNFTGPFAFEQANTSPSSGATNSFDPVLLGDGRYTWNVLCYDEAQNSGWASSNYTVRVDGTDPVVTLLEPHNDSFWNLSNTIVFNYTAIDNVNVTNCSFEAVSNISTQHVEDTSITTGITQNFTVTLANNKYNWTVACTDQAGNTHSPGFYNLTIEIGEDTVGPSVLLESPDDNNWTNSNNVDLVYTPNDASDINQCELYIDGQYNQTDTSVENTLQNNFTLSNIAEGTYQWNINCTDNSTNLNEGQSSSRLFNVDRTAPGVSLIVPQDGLNTTSPIQNFTWYGSDNMASTLYCDLTVDAPVASGLVIANNDYGNYSYRLTDGTHAWNITCRDEAYNFDSSPTWSLTLDSTPPTISLINPEDGYLSPTDNITFEYMPNDVTSGLKQCNLLIDGSFNQSDTTLQNDALNNFTVNNMVSGDYIWQIWCSDDFENSNTSDTRTLFVDNDVPLVNRFTAIPSIMDQGQSTELIANVTDNYALDTVTAQVSYPDGTTTVNFSMTLRTGDLHNLTFTETTQRGTYTVNIIANDTGGHTLFSQDYYFFIRPGISVNKTYYDRGETVFIEGSGYDPYDNLTINITDPDGLFAIGLPDTLIINSTGGFVYEWNISYTNGQATGNYTIEAYDTNTPGQRGTTSAYIVRKPKAANRFDKNNIGDDVTYIMNESDETRVTLVTSGSEEYVNMSWGKIVPDGQTLSDVRFYLEHIETQNYNLYVMWWNQTAQLWEDVCTIPAATAAETIDSCDLNDEVYTSADANNILLKVTDKNNYGSSIGSWTNLDFAYIEIKFTTLLLDNDVYAQGDKVNITGSRWPASTQLTLNVTWSDGTEDSQTTLTDTNGDFNALYNVSYAGSLGTYNLTVYVTDFADDQDTARFDVVKRNSSISADKIHYTRTETVNLTGVGFSNGGNVSIHIHDSQGVLRLNDSVIAQGGNGTIQYDWYIPYEYSGYGRHIIIAKDAKYPNLNGTANITIGVGPNTAVKTQNAVVSDVTALVNVSDDNVANLAVYDADEDSIRFEFIDAADTTSVLNNITLHVEHYEDQPYDLVVEWWDGSWVDVCRIRDRASEGFDDCNLLSYIQRTPLTDNVTLKITDNQTDFGTPGQSWTNIDFAYVSTYTEPDLIAPSVQILSPLLDTYNYSQGVHLRLNISDNVQVDSVYANVTWPSGSQILPLTAQQTNDFGEGIYEASFTETAYLALYNVTFYVNDTAGNLNGTQTINFTIASPDLAAIDMHFADDSPVENQQLTINLTIENRGNEESGVFTVRFYEETLQGTQIGSDIVVSSLSPGSNTTVQTMWNTEPGTHIILGAADVPISSNGSVWEINESNNVFSRDITIPSYHVYFGNTSGLIKLDISSNASKYTWNLSNGGNIYVVETGTDVGWLSLQALGRDTGNFQSFDDFYDADIVLGLENYTDSINESYTRNNQPILTKSIDIYEQSVSNIAVINSTNSSLFQTGVLWDTSDGSTSYDGSQDLIFITEIARKSASRFGTVDYEVRVPSTLDTYKLGSGRVTFYTEIH